MEKLTFEIPQTFSPHGNCCDCKWWMHDFQRTMVLMPDGNLVPADQVDLMSRALLAQGKPMSTSSFPRFQSAACWRHPQWQMQPGQHYCGDFEAEVKS